MSENDPVEVESPVIEIECFYGKAGVAEVSRQIREREPDCLGEDQECDREEFAKPALFSHQGRCYDKCARPDSGSGGDGVAGKPTLNQSDGIHPNKKGVVVIVERILPRVVSILKTLKKDQLRD